MASSLSMPPAVGADEVRVQIFWVQQKRRGGPIELINKSECTYALATSFRIMKMSFFGGNRPWEKSIFCSSADLTTIFNAETGASGQEASSSEVRRKPAVHATASLAHRGPARSWPNTSRTPFGGGVAVFGLTRGPGAGGSLL